MASTTARGSNHEQKVKACYLPRGLSTPAPSQQGPASVNACGDKGRAEDPGRNGGEGQRVEGQEFEGLGAAGPWCAQSALSQRLHL